MLKNIAIKLRYIVYKDIQTYFVNEIFHNKALMEIVAYVSYSCALNVLNICTFTLHIHQTLATFPVMQFTLHLFHLEKTGRFSFL